MNAKRWECTAELLLPVECERVDTPRVWLWSPQRCTWALTLDAKRPMSLQRKWCWTIVCSKKTDPRQPQQTVACTTLTWCWHIDHWSNKKKKTVMCGAKTIVKFGYGCCSCRYRLNTAVCTRPLKILLFIATEHFETLWRLLSGWGSSVGSFLLSETSTFAIDNGDKAKKGRKNLTFLLQIDKRVPERSYCSRASKKEACLLLQKKNSSRILFCTNPSKIFSIVLSAPHQWSCGVKLSATEWPLRMAGCIGRCTAHNCSEWLLVGQKTKPLISHKKRNVSWTQVCKEKKDRKYKQDVSPSSASSAKQRTEWGGKELHTSTETTRHRCPLPGTVKQVRGKLKKWRDRIDACTRGKREV